MRFLKIPATDLIARNLRGDCQDRNTASMTVIQAVDQVHITGTTTTGTHGQRSAQMCFRAGRKRPNFLVPHWDPNDVLTSANGVGNAIQGVSCDPKDALYPRCYQRL